MQTLTTFSDSGSGSSGISLANSIFIRTILSFFSNSSRLNISRSSSSLLSCSACSLTLSSLSWSRRRVSAYSASCWFLISLSRFLLRNICFESPTQQQLHLTYSSLSALAATMKASYSVTVLLSQSVRLSGLIIPSWRATTTILCCRNTIRQRKG